MKEDYNIEKYNLENISNTAKESAEVLSKPFVQYLTLVIESHINNDTEDVKQLFIEKLKQTLNFALEHKLLLCS